MAQLALSPLERRSSSEERGTRANNSAEDLGEESDEDVREFPVSPKSVSPTKMMPGTLEALDRVRPFLLGPRAIFELGARTRGPMAAKLQKGGAVIRFDCERKDPWIQVMVQGDSGLIHIVEMFVVPHLLWFVKTCYSTKQAQISKRQNCAPYQKQAFHAHRVLNFDQGFKKQRFQNKIKLVIASRRLKLAIELMGRNAPTSPRGLHAHPSAGRHSMHYW